MCWEWFERGRIEEAIDEETRLAEPTPEEQPAERTEVDEEELVPA